MRCSVRWMRAVRGGLMLLVLGASESAVAYEYKSFESDGVKLAYVDEGSGTPVILLHGFQGNFENGSAMMADALRQDFRVIGFDQRGHGRSDKPHGEHDYGLHFADDVLNLMKTLRIEKAHLVGHSMGGITAMYLAAHFPQRFHSVTTIGNGLFSGAELHLIGWLFRGKFLWGDVKALFSTAEVAADPQHDEQALKLIVSSLHALTVRPEEATAIKLPLLAARGGPEDDPNDTVERLVGVNPAVQMIRIESTDHMTLLKNDEFLGGLKRFLQASNPQASVATAAAQSASGE